MTKNDEYKPPYRACATCETRDECDIRGYFDNPPEWCEGDYQEQHCAFTGRTILVSPNQNWECPEYQDCLKKEGCPCEEED